MFINKIYLSSLPPIKNKYISTLLSMRDNQILKGIDEININYQKNLNFNDKLICLILNK